MSMTTSPSSRRRDVDEVTMFHGPAGLFGDLQSVLVT